MKIDKIVYRIEFHDRMADRTMGLYETKEEAEKAKLEIIDEMNRTWAEPDPNGLIIVPVNLRYCQDKKVLKRFGLL